MRVRTLDVPGEAAGVSLYPFIADDGSAMMQRDRQGSGWSGVLTLSIDGQRSDGLAYLTLTAAQAQDLATALMRQARFAEARAKGETGPCLCTAWSHNLTFCRNDAALDYSMCRDCWTPETGQSHLDMSHGAPAQ